MQLKRPAITLAATCIIAVLVYSGAGGCAFSSDGSGTTTSEVGASTTTIGRPSSTQRPTTTARPTTTSPSTTMLPSTTTAPPTTRTTMLLAEEYTRLPTDEKVVALTFDGAYDPAPLEDILAALEAANAHATFFLTGEFIQNFPQWTEAIISGGYPIGNHSYSHPDYTTLSDEAIRSEIQKMAEALIELGGDDPRPLLRAPYGALNERVVSVVVSEGYASVLWTIDTQDWKPERTPAQIEAAVLDKLKPGAIIIMHVASKHTAEVLPDLLAEIEARGYGFVDLREAFPGAAN